MDNEPIQTLFEQAVADSKTLLTRPSNDVLLKLYSLYKQASEGDCHAEPPTNPFDFVNKAKHESWIGLAGMSSNAAMQEYVEIIEKLKSE